MKKAGWSLIFDSLSSTLKSLPGWSGRRESIEEGCGEMAVELASGRLEAQNTSQKLILWEDILWTLLIYRSFRILT